MRNILLVVCLTWLAMPQTGQTQVKNLTPVTSETLLKPSPDDWLMFSRTYDAQRFSPLKQINRQNVGRLRMAWTRGMAAGVHENIPLVHQGVMYVTVPGTGGIQALDATNGDLIWEYQRKLPGDVRNIVGTANLGRARTLAIYGDMVYYTAPDGYVVALDARTCALRWETLAHDYKTKTIHSSGPIVVDGKVISGRNCMEATRSAGCFLVAHDAMTGKELWKFYTTAGDDDPGGSSWGGLPENKRIASPWGLPGTYDPVRKLVYWGIANPTPYSRLLRHSGNIDAVPRSAPSELYSNSTVALNPDTGKLLWYFQELPGDDWDNDHVHERTLLRTPFNPDPRAVKWINPKIPRGQERDVAVEVAEGGGIFMVDRSDGQFLWITPFPYDVPNFHLSKVDVETGKTYINWDQVGKQEGENHSVCFQNTKGYWPSAYDPGRNSLYVSYNDFCLDMKVDSKASYLGWSPRDTVVRPGSDPNGLGGLARINMATGQIQWRYT